MLIKLDDIPLVCHILVCPFQDEAPQIGAVLMLWLPLHFVEQSKQTLVWNKAERKLNFTLQTWFSGESDQD